MIKASLAQLRGVSDRLATARRTSLGRFSRKLRDAQDAWGRELDAREALVSAVAYALYGQFERARGLVEEAALPPSPALAVLALQPEFLLQLLDARDYGRAAVTAHQGREQANATSLDADPHRVAVRTQWETYAVVAEVLAGRRSSTELHALVDGLTDPHLELVSRWALATQAARSRDPEGYERELAAYRAIVPHCVGPEAPVATASTSTYR